MVAETTKKMITPDEIARWYHISQSLVYSWYSEGSLKHYRMGRDGKRGKILINEADFENFLDTKLVEANEVKDEGTLKWIR